MGVNIRVTLPQNKPRDAGDEEHHIQHNCFHIQLLFDIVIEKDDKGQEAQQREHVAIYPGDYIGGEVEVHLERFPHRSVQRRPNFGLEIIQVAAAHSAKHIPLDNALDASQNISIAAQGGVDKNGGSESR